MPTGSLILPRNVKHSFMWHAEVKKPSAADTCDGEIDIWACMVLEYVHRFDEHDAWKLTRCVCPQHFKWYWMVDTDGLDEIEGSNSVSQCTKWSWKKHDVGPNHTIGSGPGLEYATKPFDLDTDPPFGCEGSANDNNHALAMRPVGKGARFRWFASIVSASTTPGTVSVDSIVDANASIPGFDVGLGSQNFPFDVEFGIWLKSEDEVIQEVLELEEPLEAEFSEKVGDNEVRVAFRPHIDTAAIPNLPVTQVRDRAAKVVFESRKGVSLLREPA